MSDTSQNSRVLLAESYLAHLQETKEAPQKKIRARERIISIFQGHLEHKEKKPRSALLAAEQRANHEVIGLTAVDEEDVSDSETSGDESARENKGGFTSQQHVNGNNAYTNAAFDESESEEETGEDRQEDKAWRDGLRRIQRGNASPCPDSSHPGWCKHALDLRYHDYYAFLEDSEVEGEDDSHEDAMSTDNDAQAPVDNGGNVAMEDDNENEVMSDATPPSGNTYQATVEDCSGDENMTDTTPSTVYENADSGAGDEQ